MTMTIKKILVPIDFSEGAQPASEVPGLDRASATLSAPEEVAMRFSRILVPTDFSTGAQHAAFTAMALAAATGGRVKLVHLYNPPSLMLPDGSTFAATPAQLVEATDRAEAALAEALRALRAQRDE